ncbi:putative GDP-L-fucose synthase [Seiridium cardinale]
MAKEMIRSSGTEANQVVSEVRILGTGGGGLVGKALQWAIIQSGEALLRKRPKERWILLTSADGDLREINSVKSIFERWKPNVVIHLAARVGGVFANMACQADFLNDNLSINQNVLRMCHEYDVEKVISCLSTCIFPDKTTYPIDETMLHNGPPHDSNFGYAYAKRMLDAASRAYASQFGRKYTGIIPTNIYGPHDNFGRRWLPLRTRHDQKIPGCESYLIARFYNSNTQAKLTSIEIGAKSLQVARTGAAPRQLICSRDIARLLVWMVREYESVDPLILTGNEDSEMSIKDAVTTISKLSDFHGDIE